MDDELVRSSRDQFGPEPRAKDTDGIVPPVQTDADSVEALAARVARLERMLDGFGKGLGETVASIFKEVMVPKISQRIDHVVDLRTAELESAFTILTAQISGRLKRLESSKDTDKS